MDQRQESGLVALDRARELLQQTVEVLSKAGDGGYDAGGLRELIERLRKITTELDAA